MEEGELHHKGHGVHLRAEKLDELGGGVGGASGGQQVIDDYGIIAALEGVFVNVELARAVLERVLDADMRGGEFAGLADGHERDAEVLGQRRAEEKSPRFDGDNCAQSRVSVLVGEAVNDEAEDLRVLEKGRDVTEQDSELGEIRDIADERLQVHGWNEYTVGQTGEGIDIRFASQPSLRIPSVSWWTANS